MVTYIMMKNQNDMPAVTANDLNLGEESSILNYLFWNMSFFKKDCVNINGFNDDYKNGKIRGLSQLTTNYDIFTIQNDGYLNLMNHIKNSPKGLDSIISDLKHLYVNDLVFVEKANGFIEKIVDENNKWRKDNSSFYSQDYFRQEKISDEKIEFLLNSSYYKNEVYDYYGIVFFNQYPAIRTFRNGAYNTYKKITSYLNLDDDVILNPNPFHQEIDTYRNYLGNFTNKIDTVMISSENNEFIFESSYQLPETIIAVDTTSFMTSLNYFNYFLQAIYPFLSFSSI